LEALPIVERVTKPQGEGYPNCYYGMNVSPNQDLEPLDQIDGFLVAKYLQNRTGAEFCPFIAGVFDVLNARSEKEAFMISRKRKMADMNKMTLVLSLMGKLKLRGMATTAYTLWGNDDYWGIFNDVVDALDREDIEGRLPKKARNSIRFKDIPKSILGNYRNVIPNDKIDSWPASYLYIPMEVAEALWFKEKWGVGLKVGPIDSESIYDDIIQSYGLGIIGLTQPEYFQGVTFDGENLIVPGKRKAVPYIGRKGQNRVLLSDNIVDLTFLRDTGKNPSYERALALYGVYKSVMPEVNGNKPPAYRIMELINLARGGDLR
jgi:hypothetical protein